MGLIEPFILDIFAWQFYLEQDSTYWFLFVK